MFNTVYTVLKIKKKYTEGEMTVAQSIQCFTCALSNKF